jgi:hypothetical protein
MNIFAKHTPNSPCNLTVFFVTRKVCVIPLKITDSNFGKHRSFICSTLNRVTHFRKRDRIVFKIRGNGQRGIIISICLNHTDTSDMIVTLPPIHNLNSPRHGPRHSPEDARHNLISRVTYRLDALASVWPGFTLPPRIPPSNAAREWASLPHVRPRGVHQSLRG